MPRSLDTPPTRRTPGAGAVAGSYILGCLVAGIVLGAGLGSLIGALGPAIVVGVFAGFFGGLALVHSRFRSL